MPTQQEILDVLNNGPHVPMPSDYMHLGQPQPKYFGAGANYAPFMPEVGTNPSGIVSSILMLLGGARRRGGLPTTRSFLDRRAPMPPGFRGNTTEIEAGRRGALPEPDIMHVDRPGTPQQRTMNAWESNNPTLNNIFSNMRDFPQSVPRNFGEGPMTPDPYAGHRQGMARTRSRGWGEALNWDQQIPRVVENLQAGRNISSIARDLNVNQSVLHSELTRRGLITEPIPPQPGHRRRHNPVPYEQRAEIIREATAPGMPYGHRAKVAEKYGLTQAQLSVMVSRARERENLPQNTLALSRNRATIKEMLASGVPVQKIADQFGTTRNGVYMFMRRNNLTIKPRSESITTIHHPPENADPAIASMMRDRESKLLANRRLTPEHIAKKLQEEFNFSANEGVTPDSVRLGNGWWRRLR